MMSSPAQNGAKSPKLRSQSRSSPELTIKYIDDSRNGAPKISRLDSSLREDLFEQRVPYQDGLEHDGRLASRTHTGRSLSDVDGYKACLVALTPSRKFHLKDVARKIMMQLKVTRSFKDKDKLCDMCCSFRLSSDRFIIQDHSSDSHQQAYKSSLPSNSFKGKSSFPLGSGSGKFRLGSLREIRSRSARCPVCRLVESSLLDFHADEIKIGTHQDAVCFASWQVDGREVTRDVNGHITQARPRTRRIQLHWDEPSLEDSYLVLIPPGQGRRLDWDPQAPWESTTIYLGRNIASASNNQALAKRWFDLCNECHGDSCKVQHGKSFEEMIASAFFGVVDVHEMKLTSLPPKEPYAALSYMWGAINKSFTTTLHNIQARQSPGELGKIFHSLPMVIQDAIDLVRGLGMKYIWVDSLCIVQDSARSWSLNSALMDQVYGNAHLTICAADGMDAEAGLRGISLDRVVSQHSQECGSVRLMVSHLAETYVDKSRWNTRAWTFQERLLSRRCLVFAGNRMFFQCRSAAMSEDIVAEQKKGGWSVELVQAPFQLLQALVKRPFWVYMECLRLYTTRDLTHSRDILAAFQGMANLISQKLSAPLIFGLPASHFDLALLWEPTQKCSLRVPRDEQEKKEFEGMVFPSWSWCGWQGSAMEYRKETIAGCLEDIHGWIAHHTWINWYIRDSRGNLRLIWDKMKARPMAPETELRWRGYSASSSSSDRGSETDNYGRPTATFHADQHRYHEFLRTLPEYPYKISITDKDPLANQPHQDQQYLQFWTWSAYLRVIPHEQTNDKLGAGLDRYDIADYTGDWCGTVVLDDPYRDVSGSEQEFIAISEAKEFTLDENDNWTYYVPQNREQSDWGLYYVLLIKRHHGIARRVGLGKVFKDAFANSCLPGRKWREIILQ